MAAQASTNASNEVIHILDLPQLYTRPSNDALISALDMLAIEPPTFGLIPSTRNHAKVTAANHEVAAYLTRIVSSPLAWLSNEHAEIIRDLASRRLAERSGRTGMASFTRSFLIPLTETCHNRQTLDIRIHEPALTGDDLGHKTWSSSYVMAKMLPTLMPTLHPCANRCSTSTGLEAASCADCVCVTLELGAGTGLLGISYAALTHRRTLLTDLPEIVPNLARNLALNKASIDLPSSCAQQQHSGSSVACATLDWTSPLALDLHMSMPIELADCDPHLSSNVYFPSKRLDAQLILVADPIYSPEHPRLLVDAITAHLAPPPPLYTPPRDGSISTQTYDKSYPEVAPRVLIAYPVSRAAYLPQILELKTRLRRHGLKILLQGMEDDVIDDWDESVAVEWTIWGWESDVAT